MTGMTCGNCDGTGTLYDGTTCATCGGTGHIDVSCSRPGPPAC